MSMKTWDGMAPVKEVGTLTHAEPTCIVLRMIAFTRRQNAPSTNCATWPDDIGSWNASD
jgi:hypothetical protein